MKMKEFVRKNAKETTTSIKFFSEQPLNSLGQLIPVGMVALSMVGFIVAIIKFVIGGGYSNQIMALKWDFFGGISEGFTSGTASILTSGIVSTIVSILLLAELLILIVSYYRTESKTKKIIASICLGIGLVLFGVAGFILAVAFGIINLSEQMEMKIIEMLTVFNGMYTSTIVNGLKIAAIIGVVALIVFIILMLVSEHKWMIKNSAIAFLLSYIILPLTLLLVENIIPMIGVVVVLVVLGVVAILGGEVLLSEGGESSGSSRSSSSGRNISTSSSNSRPESKPKENNQKKLEYNLNTTFWRDKGGSGIITPQADCIYVKDVSGYKAYVCTVEDFEKGNVAIINKRVRVTSIAGCKPPRR